MPQIHSEPRRGSSLIIMLATIAAGAVIVGVAVVVLVRIMGFGSAAGDHLARTVTVARLAEQFRTDVAAARTAEIDLAAAESQGLKLTLAANHTITYDVHEGGVERIVEQDGRRTHTEQYAPAGLTAKRPELVRDLAKTSSPQIARLQLERTPLVESHSPQPPRGILIEGQVGRDHRFAPREDTP